MWGIHFGIAVEFRIQCGCASGCACTWCPLCVCWDGHTNIPAACCSRSSCKRPKRIHHQAKRVGARNDLFVGKASERTGGRVRSTNMSRTIKRGMYRSVVGHRTHAFHETYIFPRTPLCIRRAWNHLHDILRNNAGYLEQLVRITSIR